MQLLILINQILLQMSTSFVLVQLAHQFQHIIIQYQGRCIQKYNIIMQIQQKTQHGLENLITKLQQNVTVAIITWNLHGTIPPQEQIQKVLHSKLFKTHQPQLILFATQQCEKSLAASFCCEDKSQWQDQLNQTLKKQYKMHSSITMQGLHSILFAKYNIFTTVQLEKKKKMKAGFLNVIGNKGAVSIEINIYGQNIQFINCHLAPHNDASQARNHVIDRILHQLVENNIKSEIFICGDFNYRIQMNHQDYHAMIKDKSSNTDQQMKYSQMFEMEQLHNQQYLKQNFLNNYIEGKIKFPPTYKINQNDNQYCKVRVPGWTDRIFNRKGKTRLISYNCVQDALGSDHRPVLAFYQVPTDQGLSVFADDFVSVQGQSKCTLI